MGGYDGQQYLQDVECYDPVSNDWDKVKLCHYLRQNGKQYQQHRSGSERRRGNKLLKMAEKCVCFEVDRKRFSVHKFVPLNLLFIEDCLFSCLNFTFSKFLSKNMFFIPSLFKVVGGMFPLASQLLRIWILPNCFHSVLKM